VTAEPTRRALLAASAALPLVAAAGCKGVGALAAPPAQAADVGMLKEAIAAEELMIARYQAVLAAPHRARGLALVGETLLAEHRAHLAQLRSRLIVPAGTATASSLPPPTGPGGHSGPGKHSLPGGQAVPGRPAAAIVFLRAAEQHASDVLLSQLRIAPASLAQLLASISASEATHAAILAPGGQHG
jgi:hypothetical protein